jgi:phospholipase C
VALLLGSANVSQGSGPVKVWKNRLAQLSSHISQVVFLMQENHAFDNLFGEYCPSVTKFCRAIANGIPPATCVPKNPLKPGAGCFIPYNLTAKQLAPPDLPHEWVSTHASWNKGAMNGFYAAEGNTTETFGHYNATTVPLYYDLAEEYGLADNFFSGSQSYSLPNHWYEVSPRPPAVIQQNYPQANTTVRSQYLSEANTSYNIERQLLKTNVSWNYYDFALPATYNQSITHTRGSKTPAFDLWNPLAANSQSYHPNARSHFQPRTSFFTDARNGTLPNISWLIPQKNFSDHPPTNLSTGQDWVASVVNAIEGSPQWNSTVLFISWDEYGGFYDHVAPPTLDANGAGFRVPLLAIGPWVRQGYIDHRSMDFSSILHLMENRFGLWCMAPRDCNAEIPYSMFDFNRTAPRAPIGFPSWANSTYPMPLQSSGGLPPFGSTPRTPWFFPGAGDGEMADGIDWN